MIPSTRDSSGCGRRGAAGRRCRVGVRRDLELDDLHLPVGEHVRLTRGRHADRPGDRVRGLELGGDREVDVQPSLAPQVDVLDVRRPDHARRPRRLHAGERAGDEVDLVPRRARDEQVSVRGARLLQRLTARAVPLDRPDVEAIRERLEPLADGVDHGEVVLTVERLDDGRADLSCTDDDDPHAAGQRTPPAESVRSLGMGTLDLVRRAALLSIALAATVVGSGAFASGAASPRLVVVARGLESPVHVTQAPGEPNRLYVVEQIGRIRVIERGALRPGRSSTSAAMVVARRRARPARAGVLADSTLAIAPST